MEEKNTHLPHSLSMENRKMLKMNGVQEVISYNEQAIILQTSQGNLQIKGRELNIKQLNLDDGSLQIQGHIFSLEYKDKINQKGLINKLFK